MNAGPVGLEGAVLLQRTAGASLWRSAGRPRLVPMVNGRYQDGWLEPVSRLTIRPRADRARRGMLQLRLSLPTVAPAQRLEFKGPGLTRTIALEPGQTRSVSLPVEAKDPWRLVIRADRPFVVEGSRFVAVMMDLPRFIQNRKTRRKAADTFCR